MKTLIAPSILSADFGKLNQEINSVEANADLIHCDVMDGCFVPNITFGNEVIKCIKTPLPLDAHLMIEKPEKHVKEFARAGAKIISFHLEATKKPDKTISLIQKNNARPAIAIKPNTPIKKITPFMKKIDFVLIMTVEPGYGGQGFIPSTLEKIAGLRKLFPEIDIEVDGGINPNTAGQTVKAGANILVAGSAIFGEKNRAQAIKKIRTAAEKHLNICNTM